MPLQLTQVSNGLAAIDSNQQYFIKTTLEFINSLLKLSD
jgi:hypothetical protein